MRIKGLVFLLLFSGLYFSCFAQVNGTQHVAEVIEDTITTAKDTASAEEIDSESQIIEAKDYAAQNVVSTEQMDLDYADTLELKDSLVYHLCILKGEQGIIPYDRSSLEKTKIDRAFSIILFPNSKKVFSISEMIINDNGAWDFIYQRLFDTTGNIRAFVRKYNTFNSHCAQVAFEVSRYFFNDKGEQIAKTYQIFDQKGVELDINSCEMAREDYTKEKTFTELNDKYNFPLDTMQLPTKDLSEPDIIIEDKQTNQGE
jgi:hypothetical protein